MKLVIDIAALNKTQSAVVSITDTTPVAQIQQLTLGGSEPLDITFTDSSASPIAAPSWAGQSGYILNVGLGSTDADALLDYTSTTSFTPQTAGWTGRLNLATQLLIDATKLQCGFSVDRARFGGGYDGTTGALQARPRWAYFYLQISVTDPSGNTVPYAVIRTPLLNRVLPGTVITDTGAIAAVYAWIKANAVINAALTGIASNTANTAYLRGITTANGAIPLGAKLLGGFPGNIEILFEFVASTSTSSGWLFAPYDYNATTNPYQWRLRQVFYLGAPCFPNVGTGLWHENSAVGTDGNAVPAMNPTGFPLPA